MKLSNVDWGSMAEVLTAVATLLAVVVAFLTIRAKRRDDRRADRLSRINRQLSELYGKLTILNETGMRNWYSFVSQHSNDSPALDREFRRFFPYAPKADEPITAFNPAPPDAEQLKAYRKWLRTLFMKTNEGMLDVIYANADLVVGRTMPPVLVSFAEHVASLRLLLLHIEEEEAKVKEGVKESVFSDDWREYVHHMAAHPGGLGHYINASFEVLKGEQERLLSTHSAPFTEKAIAERIRRRHWEKESYWCKKEHEVRAKAGQHYLYKPVPELERTTV